MPQIRPFNRRGDRIQVEPYGGAPLEGIYGQAEKMVSKKNVEPHETKEKGINLWISG